VGYQTVIRIGSVASETYPRVTGIRMASKEIAV